MKIALSEIVCDNLDLEKVNNIDRTPLVINAILSGLPDIAHLIITKLYNQDKIIIKGDYESFHNKMCYDITIISKNVPNYYNLVLKQLKQDITEELTESSGIPNIECDNITKAVHIILLIFKLAIARITNNKLFSEI